MVQPHDRAKPLLITHLDSIKSFSILLLVLFLHSCASNPANIDTGINLCCSQINHQTFTLKTKDIPAFLAPTMRSSFTAALQEKGLSETNHHPDITIELRYEQLDLNADQITDDFQEQMSSNSDIRFIAKIIIDITETKANELIFSAYIQRIHNVGAGEFMHTGKASAALTKAFQQILGSINPEITTPRFPAALEAMKTN